jgi:phage protein D
MSNLRLAPEARIVADGQPLPAALRASISRISVTLGLEGADRLELTVSDEVVRWLDHPQIGLDRELRVELGYAPDPLEQVFVGDVVGLTPSFPSGGAPALTIVAQDRRARLQRGTKTRWFAVAIPCIGAYPVPDPVVAGVVTAEHQLTLASDPVSLAIAGALGGVEYGIGKGMGEGDYELIRKQRRESDLDFLTTIARENGWLMTVDHAGARGGNVLRFTSFFAHLVPDVIFRYGESLMEFSPRLTKVGEVLRVTARFWIPQIKVEMTVTASWDWDRQALEVSASSGSGLPGGTGGAGGGSGSASSSDSSASTMLHGEEVSAKTASRAMLAKLIDKLNQRLTGSASVVGDTRLRPGGVVQIDGVGELFGGPYRVTSVSHTLDSGGFRTSFEVRKEVWFDGAHLMRGAQAAARSAVAPMASPLSSLTEAFR